MAGLQVMNRFVPGDRVLLDQGDEVVVEDFVAGLCADGSLNLTRSGNVQEHLLVPALDDLDRPDVDYLLDIQREKRRALESEDLRNSLVHLGELYSRDSHVAYELVQNANDANASRIRLDLTELGLNCTNNGQAFRRRDISGICSVPPRSSKEDDKIGRFGIGFRSVYAITDQPTIRTGDLEFSIVDRLVPMLAESSGLRHHTQTSIWLPFNSTAEARARFAKDLVNLSPRTILFLSHIDRLEVAFDGVDELILGKQVSCDTATGSERVTLIRNGEPFETWLLFRGNGGSDDILPFEIAIQVDEGDDVVPIHDAVAFVYLPTEQATGLPFLFQAKFDTPRSRERIRDTSRNLATLRAIGRALPGAAARMQGIGSEPRKLLGILPLADELAEPLFGELVDQATEAARTLTLAPTGPQTWSKPSAALLFAEGDEPLRTLLSSRDLSALVGRPASAVSLPRGGRARNRRVLGTLGVDTFDLELLLAKFESDEFLRKRRHSWIASLYAFLSDRRSSIDKQRLTAAPLVRRADGVMVSADSGVLLIDDIELANQVLEILGHGIGIVDPRVYSGPDGEKAREFLAWLGVETLNLSEVIARLLAPALSVGELDDKAASAIEVRIVNLIRTRAAEYVAQQLRSRSVTSEVAAYSHLGALLRLRFRSIDAAGGEVERGRDAPSSLFLGPDYDAESRAIAMAERVAGVRVVDKVYLGRSRKMRTDWLRFFELVGVERPGAAAVIDRVILPRHTGGGWRSSNLEILRRDLDFVRLNLRAYSQTRGLGSTLASTGRGLGAKLFVRTKGRDDKGLWTIAKADTLYFPREARTAVDLESLLSDLPGKSFVYDGFFSGPRPSSDDLTWVAFFSYLGVANYPRVVKRGPEPFPSEIYSKEYSRISTNESIIGSTRLPTRLVVDFESPDLQSLIVRLAATQDIATAKRLYDALARGWTDQYADKLESTLEYFPFRAQFTTNGKVPSRFVWALANSSWVPTIGGLTIGRKAYLGSAEVRAVLGDDQAYIDVQESGPEEFRRAVGIRDTPQLPDVLAHLCSLRTTDPAADNLPVASYAFMHKHLLSHVQDFDSVRTAFEQGQLVATRSGDPAWRSPSTVLWERDAIVGDYRPALSTIYPKSLRPFFESIGVERAATFPTYVSVLEELGANASDTVSLNVVASIYQRLSALILTGAYQIVDDKDVRGRPILDCGQHGFRSANEEVYLNDEPAVGQLFEKVPQVNIPAAVPVAAVQPLFNLLGVPLVSTSVVRVLRNVHGQRDDETWTSRIRAVAPMIERWLYFKAPVAYESQGPVARSFSRIRVIQAERIDVDISLGDHTSCVEPAAYLDTSDSGAAPALFTTSCPRTGAISKELTRAFAPVPGLAEAVQMLCWLPMEEAESFLNENGVGALPAAGPVSAGSHGAKGHEPVVTPDDEQGAGSDEDNVTGSGGEAAARKWGASGATESSTENTRPSGSASDADRQVGESTGESGLTADSEPGHNLSSDDLDTRHGPVITSTTARSDRHVTENQSQSGSGFEGEADAESDIEAEAEAHRESGEADAEAEPIGRQRSNSRPVLRSYVPMDADSLREQREGRDHTTIQSTADAAVSEVMSYERAQGRVPKDRSPDKCGWDVESREPETGDVIRRIEVKGINGPWDGWVVEVTRNEFQKSLENRESWWLYVVEHALDPERRRLFAIANPTSRATGFLFDGAWSKASDESWTPTA